MDCTSRQDNIESRAKSIGEVASPLLAGFSFTNVIVIVVSGDTGHFLLPGEAIISWTIASVALIASVQFAKYVAGETGTDAKAQKWDYRELTDIFYHIGVLVFLLGFSFALTPQRDSGAYVFRWIAAGIAFAVFLFELNVYRKRGSSWRYLGCLLLSKCRLKWPFRPGAK